jgi:hypothetical protein
MKINVLTSYVVPNYTFSYQKSSVGFILLKVTQNDWLPKAFPLPIRINIQKTLQEQKYFKTLIPLPLFFSFHLSLSFLILWLHHLRI